MTVSLYFDTIAKNVEIECRILRPGQYFRLSLGSEACTINTPNIDVNIFAADIITSRVGADMNIVSDICQKLPS